ncbi:hypothetical protein PIIN_10977 [Serendipita indica DSM 11827]|uniref:GST N-terminal domain-containing protein n=1 Tax=Serendipita indica (strain DSM 11827) TaxID=1109443 RepID=G4U099_SERID|nr:hypothetical protein PIIN_10977 [Serendipita indica DSM 11827]
MSKPVLYRFGGAWLHGRSRSGERVLEGENLEVSYLKITAQSTIPTLVPPTGELYDSSTSSTQYLNKNAPQGVKTGKPADPKLLKILHADNINPNVFLLAARNQEELDTKNQSVPGYFVRAHYNILQRVLPTAPAEFKKFYDAKVAKTNGLSAI